MEIFDKLCRPRNMSILQTNLILHANIHLAAFYLDFSKWAFVDEKANPARPIYVLLLSGTLFYT